MADQDKWRNLSVSAGQGSREKSRAKNNQVNAEYSTPDSLIQQIVHSDAAVDDDSSNGAQDGTNAARCVFFADHVLVSMIHRVFTLMKFDYCFIRLVLSLFRILRFVDSHLALSDWYI